MKILLTSAGFENKNIEKKFLELVEKDVKDIKVLFITTAAVEVDAIKVLPNCLDDLLDCGIDEKNITVYDMHKLLSQEEFNKYDAIYVCGGNTSYLVERIKEIKFKEAVYKYLESGGIYIGVSAGSTAASLKYEDGLDFIKNKVEVHCDKLTTTGKINKQDTICLTDNQAILITDEEKVIIE